MFRQKHLHHLSELTLSVIVLLWYLTLITLFSVLVYSRTTRAKYIMHVITLIGWSPWLSLLCLNVQKNMKRSPQHSWIHLNWSEHTSTLLSGLFPVTAGQSHVELLLIGWSNNTWTCQDPTSQMSCSIYTNWLIVIDYYVSLYWFLLLYLFGPDCVEYVKKTKFTVKNMFVLLFFRRVVELLFWRL